MKLDTLMSFGCSHMYGWGHKSTENNTKPSDDAYTNLLANHYNLHHYNFSEGGTSNQGISRQIIFAQDFEKENNLNSIYWIQWTDYRRLELPYKLSKNICKNWPYVKVLGEVKNHSSNKLLSNWANSLYKNIDDLALFVLSCNAIIQVNSFLLAKNKKVINTFAHTWDTNCEQSTYYIKEKKLKSTDTLYNELIFKNTEEIDIIYKDNILQGNSGKNYKTYDPYTKKLWKQIKEYNWYNWRSLDTADTDIGFKPWASNLLEDALLPCGHPTEKAHMEAFTTILQNEII